MKKNSSCFYLRYLLNAYLLINGVFIWNAHQSYKEQAEREGSVGGASAWQWKNAFPAGFTTEAEQNTRFYAAENTFLHNIHVL